MFLPGSGLPLGAARYPGGCDSSSNSRFNSFGKVRAAIALETTEASLIGGIQSIKLDPGTGDLLVGDFRASKKIFRFAGDGRFLRSYGRVGQGPGEYEAIHGFAPMENGRILIGYCEDPDLLRKHAADHPVLAGMDFDEIDNPVILFFRLGRATQPGGKTDDEEEGSI